MLVIESWSDPISGEVKLQLAYILRFGIAQMQESADCSDHEQNDIKPYTYNSGHSEAQ